MFRKLVFLNPHKLFLTGLITIAVGLSLSKPLIGIGQGILGFAWVLEGNLWSKTQTFFKSKLAWALIAYYVLTLFGLLYTSDYGFALDDVRRKLPLFVLPFVLFSKSFNKKEIKLIFSVYVAAIIASSFWSIFVKLGGLGIEITDVRDLSRFNSHIRFGLEICLAIFGASYYWYESLSTKERLAWSIVIIWLLAFMVIISLITGLIVLTITSFLLAFILGYKIKKRTLKWLAYLLPFTFVIAGIYTVQNIYQYFNENNTPLKERVYTPNGSKYFNDHRSDTKENGFFVWKNNCWDELEAAWEKRSNIPFDGNDYKGQKLSNTLIRFLTSKGVYKDYQAVEDLTNEEVAAIENGVANYKKLRLTAFEKRLFDIFWEYENYKNGGDYNGHSLIMRLEYWKTGLDIFMNHQLIGVGTGDIKIAYEKQYELQSSKLTKQYRLRAHNQFITVIATFGLIGLIIFFWFLVYPLYKTNGHNSFLYLVFFIIITTSMLTEDTLDTQVGITFFAFFNSLFLLNHCKS